MIMSGVMSNASRRWSSLARAAGSSQSALTMASNSMKVPRSVSQEMSSNAEETSVQANVASASAEQVDANIQTVAIAVEAVARHDLKQRFNRALGTIATKTRRRSHEC